MIERVILAGVDLTQGSRTASKAVPRTGADLVDHAEESLAELATLAASAGGSVVHQVLQRRPRADSATLIGSGKVEELKAEVKAFDAHTVIFDNELSPTQQRNLERELDVKVIDRTQLILDIFARRARTSEGQLQVELAQLSYLLPRLTGHGLALSRQGGGIGTRGPGETQLETDRRKISTRIKIIERSLENVRAGRGIQRRQRQSVPLSTIALVGYTNAGKSTLFNRLTGAAVLADAKMFATLDLTVRHVILPSRRKILLSDTVGFIRNLPTTLVKAFRATLEEVREAELLLHVVDASSEEAAEHTAHVLEVLKEIEASDKPQILVLNKMDAFTGTGTDASGLAGRILGDATMPAAIVSGRTGDGVAELLKRIDETLSIDPVSPGTFRFPVGDGAVLNLLHELAVVRSTDFGEEYCTVIVDAPRSVHLRLGRFLVDQA